MSKVRIKLGMSRKDTSICVDGHRLDPVVSISIPKVNFDSIPVSVTIELLPEELTIEAEKFEIETAELK